MKSIMRRKPAQTAERSWVDGSGNSASHVAKSAVPDLASSRSDHNGALSWTRWTPPASLSLTASPSSGSELSGATSALTGKAAK